MLLPHFVCWLFVCLSAGLLKKLCIFTKFLLDVGLGTLSVDQDQPPGMLFTLLLCEVGH